MYQLSAFHIIGLPLLLAPTYLGYYFNMHVIQS